MPMPMPMQMIKQALTELGGTSGRSAIAAFILSRFTGLPATHDKLLKANLRRLVSEGVVRARLRVKIEILQLRLPRLRHARTRPTTRRRNSPPQESSKFGS